MKNILHFSKSSLLTLLFVVVSSVMVSAFQSLPAFAWNDLPITQELLPGHYTPPPTTPGPTTAIDIGDPFGNRVETRQGQVTQGATISLASDSQGKYIQIGKNNYFRPFSSPFHAVYLIPGTDRALIVGEESKLYISDNLANILEPLCLIDINCKRPNDYIMSYSINWTKLTALLSAEKFDNVRWISDLALTQDRRFGTFLINGTHLIKADLLRGSSTMITSIYATYGSSNTIDAISADGRFIFINKGTVIDTAGICGTMSPSSLPGYLGTNYTQCLKFTTDTTKLISEYHSAERFYLSPDETKGYILINRWNPQKNSTDKYTVIIANLQDTPNRIAYLALGDSYSSGEGDTELNPRTKLKHYLLGTDINGNQREGIPREKCHISDRSYPMLLARTLNTGGLSSYSVACSGAVIRDINGGGVYEGQALENKKPRLKDFSNRQSLQNQALEQTLPGRVQQIEHVKKLKPKVITLTAGGNDAQFGEVIRSCINLDPLKDWTPTCHYADDDNSKNNLRNFIARRYDELKSLYVELHNASPDSKIYVIGYPQFINSTVNSLACGPNVRLTKAERIMVAEATDYMNSVIEAAAKSAGVKYISVRDALDGHKLCDNAGEPWKNYVTGLAFMGTSEIQESFHPNHKGHEAIATTIQQAVNRDLINYNYCQNNATTCPDNSVNEPATPQYFVTKYLNKTATVATTFTKTQVKRGETTLIDVLSNTVLSSSPIFVTMYSQQRDLGMIVATNKGGISQQIAIPSDIEPGYHTLVLSGKSPSGNDINIVQFIEVIASDTDADGDGIPDDRDQCRYITPSGQDIDGDGIDDACDGFISEPAKTTSKPATNTPPAIQMQQPAQNQLITSLKPKTQSPGLLVANTSSQPGGLPIQQTAVAPPVITQNKPQATTQTTTKRTIPSFIWIFIGAFSFVGLALFARQFFKKRI